ncbi:MAG: ComF family protein [Candidatus Margulisbacteria bacterium]|nr:ComF family protein [Candidatus Margulisiibacteriota bacterium]MBU1022536.1 ComF family protein [Candidatus Margulisiibacteriota bacterium]MBU1728822.1 ComF family protein [Candidatus Margulisiibacteriota bacterium]MBU1955788.1 ComF family protein [Candidatus Margulisiibacteriota bacterium]
MVLNLYLSSILDLIFPPRCQICREPGPENICKNCITKIKTIDQKNVCVYCGEPQNDQPFKNAVLCSRCVIEKPHYTIARSIAIYEGTLKKAIHAFKFKGKKNLAQHLGKFMALSIEENLPEIRYCHADAVVTVPLSQNRLKSRGFNQIDCLAEVFSAYANIPHEKDILARVRDTKPQFDLPKHKRKENIQGAFVIKRPNDIYGRRLLLLDDIYTTGYTVNECAKVLIKCGAAKVYILTLSRAILA